MHISTIIIITWAILQLTTLILERFQVIRWRQFWIWSPTIFIIGPMILYVLVIFVAFLVAYG